VTALPVLVDPAVLTPGALLWPALLGLSLYLLVTSQPVGKPKPGLAERLRRLDVDERLRMELRRRAVRPYFASRLLEGMLRPVAEDCGALLRALLGRFGLAGGAELERALRVLRPGVEPVQFFGEKVVLSFVGLAFFPTATALGLSPFGPWPLWAWATTGALGFILPDWDLARKLAARRTAALFELAPLVDMLSVAVAAGLGLEQALLEVAGRSRGLVGEELLRASREAALGQARLVDALEAVARRNGLPELSALVGRLRAAHEQGLPLVQTLGAQAEALREQRRLRLVEEGGKATVMMVAPTALFLLPVLLVVLLLPAVVQVASLGG
jgi:tight adherence protein C